MDGPDTFTMLPLHIDPTSKIVSSTYAASPALQEELDALNNLHQQFKTLETPAPPPPVPVNQKRSANINKLRESGNTEFRKNKFAESITYYTLGIQMALGRPLWEPSGLVKDEVAGLYANRAQAYMALQNWPEGAIDAESSVEAKKVGNAKAWWRRGRCLMEMGRVQEARDWVSRGLEVEGNETDLVGLLKELDARDAKKSAA